MRKGTDDARLNSGSALILALIVAVGSFTGCTTPKTTHKVSEAPLPIAEGKTGDRVSRETYAVDAAHSAALFKVKHFGISLVAGRFTDISGTIVADRDDPSKSSVEIVIKTASVNTDLKARDKHLRNADFLDVEKFPVMTFKSKRVRRLKENVGEVTGSFTLHGVTKTITVTVTFLGETDVPWGQHLAGFETAFNIKRSDYGMDKLLKPVGDNIQISLLVEAKRTDPPPKKKTGK